MFRSLSLQAVTAGLLAALIGFASSFAVILQGLRGVGATEAEAASGLMALSISMGLCGIFVSARTRQPISIAWSTPGAALLATTGVPSGGFPTAVGAFVLCAILIITAGLYKPLGRLIAAIPGSLASGMLAGVLFGMCLAPVRAVAAAPAPALAIIAVWLLVARIRRLFAVPACVLVALVIIVTMHPAALAPDRIWPAPVLVAPSFSAAGLIGIALPLFLVTMASQNIPGLAVLGVNGYPAQPGRLFTATGVSGLLAAPFGGHAVCLAAITAALCAGYDAHPDPARRYWAAIASGVGYIAFGVLARLITGLISTAPLLIEAVAGLALLGAFGGAIVSAAAAAAEREAAILTFLVTASGVTILGISPAFWGLIAGATMLALERGRARFSS